MTASPNLPGLYVHFPFCATICPYCDFYVLTGDRHSRQVFVDYLLAEIELCASTLWPALVDEAPEGPFDTIYFGGGTPSLLTPDQLQSLLDSITDGLPIAPRPWIGLEANPEDVDQKSLHTWRALGIDFLSLGVQSFDDQRLEYLGRAHGARKARESVDLARQSGIETISVDLIYGLPGETSEDWRAELATAFALRPDHFSCYQLTVEPQTPFGFRQQRGRFIELSTEEQAERFISTHELLEEQGFAAYEVSNFAASPDHQSRHNRKYWNHTPYLGLGPSAHSLASRQRWWNSRKIKPYMEKIDTDQRPIDAFEKLSESSVCLEYLMLGLRTPRGVDFDSFPGERGPSIRKANLRLIDDLLSSELATLEGSRLLPTLPGLAVAEAIARRFDILEGNPPGGQGIC